MRYVVHKGIAGLGNRLQALGRSLDLAEQEGATLIVDWRDMSWQEGLDSCFNLASPWLSMSKELAMATEWGRTAPNWWTPERLANFKRWDWDNWYEASAIKEPKTSDGFEKKVIAEGADTLVICRYSANYTDRLFEVLYPTTEVLDRVGRALSTIGVDPFDYPALHVRHTDKKSLDPFAAIDALKVPTVVCTDSAKVRDYAIENGHACPSVIPQTKGGWGIHHTRRDHLEAQDLTRAELNRSAVADIIICGMAEVFEWTCRNSSYDLFIRRGIAAGWFDKIGKENTL